jgi:hypothetical protein
VDALADGVIVTQRNLAAGVDQRRDVVQASIRRVLAKPARSCRHLPTVRQELIDATGRLVGSRSTRTFRCSDKPSPTGLDSRRHPAGKIDRLQPV